MSESNLTISPSPTEEEAAAIAAALTMGWPRPAPVDTMPASSNRWRFSGRWWAKPGWQRR